MSCEPSFDFWLSNEASNEGSKEAAKEDSNVLYSHTLADVYSIFFLVYMRVFSKIFRPSREYINCVYGGYSRFSIANAATRPEDF